MTMDSSWRAGPGGGAARHSKTRGETLKTRLRPKLRLNRQTSATDAIALPLRESRTVPAAATRRVLPLRRSLSVALPPTTLR